ncbi:DUF3943 domain-containing protein [Pseudobdellovibrio sp. HCB154]|uniref:DUF3943 domain-containing protein n=1 Tax=Pseudobdellovibrio sp. HCB154 TaxID=3386277 RepID=UPI003917441D
MKKTFLKSFAVVLALTISAQAQQTPAERQAQEISPELKKIIAESSPLDRWVTKEQFQQIVKEVTAKTLAQQVIVVDTRDRQGCYEMYKHLQTKGWPANPSMCNQDPNNPYVSVTLGTEVTKDSLTPEQQIFQNNPDLFKGNGEPSERRKALYERTRNIALLSGGVVAAFASQDADSSGWDIKGLKENGPVHQVKEHWKNGPVRDKDGPFVNFVLHPISGSIYYQAARISGYGKLQSFGYSFLMSTFFWEYGVESVFETPSWNDLWATPVIGSLIGELFLQLYQKVENNNGEVLGSRKLGFGAKLLLNSAETLRPYINKIFGTQVIKSGRAGFTMANCGVEAQPNLGIKKDMCPFFTIEFKW